MGTAKTRDRYRDVRAVAKLLRDGGYSDPEGRKLRSDEIWAVAPTARHAPSRSLAEFAKFTIRQDS